VTSIPSVSHDFVILKVALASPTDTRTVESTSDRDNVSVASRVYPNAPVNSPEDSIIGDQTPSAQEITAGMNRLTGNKNNNNNNNNNNNTISQGTGTNFGTLRARRMVANHTRAVGNGVREFNQWETYAEEDVANALTRLVTMARDLHDTDPSKSVQQYFSESLMKVLEGMEVKYDCSGLHM
jgi:hypothetical protein